MSPVPSSSRDRIHTPHLERAVIAHRGLSSRAPENTAAAFRAAADCGAAWIETDVDLLGDGTPVVLHDTRLARTTDRTGSLYDLAAADLVGLDAGSWFAPAFAGEPLPTLADLVALLNECRLDANIELKGNEQGAERCLELVDAVAAALEGLDAEREIVVSSFCQPLLMAFHQRHPEWTVGVLHTAESLRPDWLSVAQLCGADYLHLEDRGLTEEMVGRARAAGYGVNVWTVNRPDRANELFNWGCTGVFTDVADVLLVRAGRGRGRGPARA